MKNPFTENRKFLSGLVFNRENFTTEEIVEAYKAGHDGDAIVDGRESIREILKGMEEAGVLEDRCGRYVVVRT